MGPTESTREMEYRPVPSIPFLRASSEGVIQSSRSKGGKPLPPGQWRTLKTHPRETGHLRVAVTVAGRSRHRYVHALVMEAFGGPCPPGLECCHDDGNPANNRPGNLRWGTHASNMADGARHGRTPRGTKSHSAKIDESGVAEVFRLRGEGLTLVAIGARLGLSFSHVGYILRGQRWKHLARGT